MKKRWRAADCGVVDTNCVSAVGHETDFTIADFCRGRFEPHPLRCRGNRDSRAAKPSTGTSRSCTESSLTRSAYSILVRQRRLQDLLAQRAFRRTETSCGSTDSAWMSCPDNWLSPLRGKTLRRFARVSRNAAARMSAFDLRARLEAMRLRTEQRVGELRLRVERLLAATRQRFERLILQLDERSPLRVLDRGYAIVMDAARATVVRAADPVAAGDEISLRLGAWPPHRRSQNAREG